MTKVYFGRVFNIQRYTIHDGPGIRTELFLKGCPLKCEWCGNPESHKSIFEPGVYTSKCIGKDKCGFCIDVCKNKESLIFKDNKLIAIDRSKCVNCMECVRECPSDAIKMWGEKISVEGAMEVIRKDITYYKKSGGGVTLSGGEPLMQIEFVKNLLKECKKEGIHTCVESTLCTDFETIEKIIPYTDLIITDIKHMNTNVHKKYTKMPNERILENIKKISKINKPMIIRIPVIPNVNDDMENMKATADFILDELDNNILTLQLLQFMRLGEEKYKSLDIMYPMENMEYDKDKFLEKVKNLKKFFNEKGINCIVGTTSKEKNNDESK